MKMILIVIAAAACGGHKASPGTKPAVPTSCCCEVAARGPMTASKSVNTPDECNVKGGTCAPEASCK